MDFVVYEHEDGRKSFLPDEGVMTLPEDVVAFTHFRNSELDENGCGKVVEWRIGVPIKYVIGDLCYELEASQVHDGNYEDKFALYRATVTPLHAGLGLVDDYEALRKAFAEEMNVELPMR